MNEMVLPRQDMHVHSTFSDGKNTIEENIEQAESLGLETLTCVDHVRMDTDWLPSYVAAIESLRPTTEVELICGIEAKLLNTAGDLDLPELPPGIDRIYAADHQVPLADGPHHPREIRAEIESGQRNSQDVIAAIAESTASAAERHEDMVIAHMFSILPKLGLDESDVPLDLLEQLAGVAERTGTLIEIDERWSCPSPRSLQPFVDRGITVLMSTDSHMREKIGR
ncbi:MAG: PHP domain-containing protein, partial [Actinomycetota bacterium]|nr:PHP domain-containing protein [Actinomycetota bacterium]